MAPEQLISAIRAALDTEQDRADSIHTLDCELTMTAGFHGPCTCGVPAAVLRRGAADRRVLDRHRPETVVVGLGDMWAEDQLACRWCSEPPGQPHVDGPLEPREVVAWPCYDFADLADRLGINPETETPE